MTEVERCWNTIDCAVSWIEGFMPAIWSIVAVQQPEVVAAESVAELEEKVKVLKVSLDKLWDACGDERAERKENRYRIVCDHLEDALQTLSEVEEC